MRSLASPFHGCNSCGIPGIPGPDLTGTTDMWLLQSRPSIPVAPVAQLYQAVPAIFFWPRHKTYEAGGTCAKCVLTFPCSIPICFQGRRARSNVRCLSINFSSEAGMCQNYQLAGLQGKQRYRRFTASRHSHANPPPTPLPV